MTENNGTFEQLAGKAKELFGKVTGDHKAEAEGNIEQTIGKIKNSVDSAVDNVKDAIEKGKAEIDETKEAIESEIEKGKATIDGAKDAIQDEINKHTNK